MHRRHKRSVDAHPTVPERQGLRDRGHLLVGEPVGVLLVGVDDDLQLTDAGVPGWPALAGGFRVAHIILCPVLYYLQPLPGSAGRIVQAAGKEDHVDARK